MKEETLKKILISVILAFLAAASFWLIADQATSVKTHAATIASIDDKVETVMTLTATSTLASAGISAIPGDTATPIAEKLADFTEYFLLILCILYAEKYLIAIVGAGTFKILIPCACILLMIGMFWNPKVMKRLATKFVVFGLAIFITIPSSIRVSDMIYDTYRESIEDTVAAAEQFTEETSELSGAKEDEGLIESILERLSETASTLSNKAAKILNSFVESLAVMIVTSCIIPILVLLFFIWFIKILTGVELSVPHFRQRKAGKKETEE